jgi:UDP-glucuronate 4-epimerase
MAQELPRYVVTGATGFIGSKVAQLLLEAGSDVVGIDSINDAYDPSLKRWRLERLRQFSQFQFHQLDISNKAALDRIVAESGPIKAVINLAARAGVRPSVENPPVYYQANVDGVLNLLEACRRFDIKKFVQASTSSLYGGHNSIPFREDADTSRPLSPYAASKGAAEMLSYTYHHLHDLDVTVLRFFTVYGPAGRPDMSVFRFVRSIAEGDPIVVFGDGKQERDFTYVDDIAAGVVAATRRLGFEVINLGGDRPVVLADMIQTISTHLEREPIIQYRPAHPADVQATWADISKAERVLGWRPQVSFEEGIRRSVEWYRENRDMAKSIDLGM